MALRLTLFIALVFAVVASNEGSPFVVIHKTASSQHVIVGSELKLVVTATNFGQSPAFDVKLTDISPVDGSVKSKSADKLEFNETVTLEYVVSPDTLGPLSVGPAEATFKSQPGDEASYKASSNTVFEETYRFRGAEDETNDLVRAIRVVTAAEFDKINTRHIKEFAAYLVLGAIPVFFPFFVYRTKQSQVDHLLREAKKK